MDDTKKSCGELPKIRGKIVVEVSTILAVEGLSRRDCPSSQAILQIAQIWPRLRVRR
jgi:hypothetical protein